MSVGPTQGDEKPLLFSNYSLWKRHPTPLSSRPERSAVEGPAVSFASHSGPLHTISVEGLEQRIDGPAEILIDASLSARPRSATFELA